MSLQALQTVGERLIFGEFELAPVARTLTRAGAPIKLGSRALDILVALASRPGQILSRGELTRLVWQGAFVDETALRVGISAVRKALGDDGERYITTVPGRGYCFVLEVETTSAGEASAPTHASPLRPQRLPASLTRIVGRERIVEVLADEVRHHRLLSLVGPGGIGKTTVALTVARQLASVFDAVAFVDLVPLENGAQIVAAAATSLGLNLRQQNAIEELALLIEGRRVLLILDNCEHLVDAVAVFVEELLAGAPALTLITTSREVLRASGEWVHQLASLEVPPADPGILASDATRFAAVELFAERAAHALGGYRLSDADAPIVCEICRRLDGIALAIELAAGRLGALDIKGLAGSLEDCFQVLTRGRRTALPRHQTLRATLDWSYRLLSAEEREMLLSLSIFSDGFSVADVCAVMERAPGFALASDRLAGLADKSLIAVRAEGGQGRRYRLLDTTRTYAAGKLAEQAGWDDLRRRHALYVRALFEQARQQWEGQPSEEWLEIYAGKLGDLRTALDWAFSSAGDGATGAMLTAAAAPIWFHLSLIDEGLTRVERAILWLLGQTAPDRSLLMQLYAISGWPQMRAMASIASGAAAWKETLKLARELGDVDFQLRALWALWVDCGNRGAATEALQLADEFAGLAGQAGEEADRGIARRLRGHSLHYLGDFTGSSREIEAMLAGYTPPATRSHLARFQYDQRLTAQITLARSLFVQGHSGRALLLVERMIEEALALDHTLTLAHILSDAACFIALWAGDLDLAARYTEMLRTCTALHALDVWRTYAAVFEGEIFIRRGRAEQGADIIRPAIRQLEAGCFVLYRTAFEGMLAEGMLACGRVEEARVLVSQAVERCTDSGEKWCLAELLRIEALCLAASGDKISAREKLEAGLSLARQQGALAWEHRLVSASSAIAGKR